MKKKGFNAEQGARLILRLEFGKMTAYEVGPELLPAIAQN